MRHVIREIRVKRRIGIPSFDPFGPSKSTVLVTVNSNAGGVWSSRVGTELELVGAGANSRHVICRRRGERGTFGFPTAWLDGLPGDRPDDAGREIAADDGVTRLAFTVPGRPQGKQRPRLGRGGRVYTPAATRRYESAVRSACLVAMMQAGLAKRYAGECGLLVRCYFPDGRRRDGDNVLKSVQDALNGLLWIDDSQVTVATVAKAIDRREPRTEVEVTLGRLTAVVDRR